LKETLRKEFVQATLQQRSGENFWCCFLQNIGYTTNIKVPMVILLHFVTFLAFIPGEVLEEIKKIVSVLSD
jgi:hypothetical protein